ncbi:fibronectin type III domain-containing protein [Treponema vincentii]|uniref:fibronectin type III domain-containing protein n=1 Tax=Treponema TaxID=157 RepID=UPI001BAF0910|nr:fibronectin type III domain-containing protein [Treponema vincentii]QUY18149.1 fibronectin type III domain-containing protein [Treponema vincentii]
MENKYGLLLAGIFFFCFISLSAQELSSPVEESKKGENEKKNYFLKETDKGVELVQRLSWEALDDIFGFEFELEQRDKKTKVWRAIDKRTVKTNYADVSLPPGDYRFRVRVINLLGQKEEASEYRNFAIRIAYQPEVTSVSPQVINFDELEEQTLTITGKNFHEETDFILTNNFSGSVLHGTIVEIKDNGTHAVVAFDFMKTNPGTYTFAAVDPSDLLAEKDDIIFRFQKPIDIFISGNYVFNGFIGNQVLSKKDYFNTNIAPLAGGIRLTVAPIKRFYGNFGFNFTGSGAYLRNKTDGYTLSGGLLFASLNAAYFVPIIKHRLVFDAHAGFGTMFLVNTQFTYNTANTTEKLTSPKGWSAELTFNAGTALYVYVYKKLYVEFNIDHVIPIPINIGKIKQGKGFPAYIIQPQLGIGWEF